MENAKDKGAIRPEDVERRYKLDYLYGHDDPSKKTLDRALSILGQYRTDRLDPMALMQRVADTINKTFWIKEVTIGLRSRADAKFRYEVMSGLRTDAWEAHRKLVYGLDQFSEGGAYNGHRISRHTILFLAEDQPYVEGEEDTFNRPILLKARRRSEDDCIEGDYLDVHILGVDDEMLGWIEISGTRDGKFPSPSVIRWVELLGEIISLALREDARGDATPVDGARRKNPSKRPRGEA